MQLTSLSLALFALLLLSLSGSMASDVPYLPGLVVDDIITKRYASTTEQFPPMYIVFSSEVDIRKRIQDHQNLYGVTTSDGKRT